MRRRGVLAAFCAAAAAFSACSLFVDTSDLQGGGGASSVDASDSTTTDSQAPSDGATREAGADAAPGFACDAALCEDFDDASTLTTVWSTDIATGGTAGVVPSGLSLPNAYEATVAVGTIDSDNRSQATIGMVGQKFRIDLDLFFSGDNDAAAAGEADFLDVEVNGGDPNRYDLYLGMFSGQWNIAEFGHLTDGGTIDHANALSVAPPAGRWTHVVFTCDGANLQVSFDGTITGSLPLFPPGLQATGVTRYLDIGWTYVDHTKVPFDIKVDNVSYAVLP